MGYKHLTKEQRYTIMVLLQAQATISRIAEVIGKSKGTGHTVLLCETVSLLGAGRQREFERTGAPVHTQGYRL